MNYFFISFQGKSDLFKVSDERPLRLIFAIFAKNKNLKGGQIIFRFGGDRLFGEETFKELQMSDGDCIHAELDECALDLVV